MDLIIGSNNNNNNNNKDKNHKNKNKKYSTFDEMIDRFGLEPIETASNKDNFENDPNKRICKLRLYFGKSWILCFAPFVPDSNGTCIVLSKEGVKHEIIWGGLKKVLNRAVSLLNGQRKHCN